MTYHSNQLMRLNFQAAIRGEAMRELGVIYNSSYYSISEHPGYQRAAGDHAEVR